MQKTKDLIIQCAFLRVLYLSTKDSASQMVGRDPQLGHDAMLEGAYEPGNRYTQI